MAPEALEVLRARVRRTYCARTEKKEEEEEEKEERREEEED